MALRVSIQKNRSIQCDNAHTWQLLPRSSLPLETQLEKHQILSVDDPLVDWLVSWGSLEWTRRCS